MSVILKSGASSNLANVDADGNLAVNLPTTATQAGHAQHAYVPSTTIPAKVARITGDGGAYNAEPRQVLDLDFNSASTTWATKIGTNATTMTKATQNGYMRLNNSAITTAATGISIYTWRTFTIENGYDLRVKFALRHNNATASNKQAEIGLGWYGFAAGQAADMNEFVGFRWTTTGGLLAVLSTSQGGAPTEQTANVNSNVPYSNAVAREYVIVITDVSVEFYVEGVFQARIAKPSGSWGIFKSVALPFIARVFNSGVASAAATFDIGDVSVMKVGCDDGTAHPFRMALMGKSSYYYQPDLTAAATATHVWPASGTAPTAAAGTNVASAANSLAVMGGLVRNTLTGVTATLSTNVLWTAYQNPVNPVAVGAATNARNFYVTGIGISPLVVTTALTGGGFTAVWFAAIGNNAISLATTDADGTTALAAKAPRIVPLPLVSTLAATAAVATVSTNVGDHWFSFPTPLAVHPGEFISVGFRTLAVAAAVTVGTADCAININGYWD